MEQINDIYGFDKRAQMKTLLIPVDFSDLSEKVIGYAASFACDTHVDRVILLKTHYVSEYAQLFPSADFVQVSNEDIAEERQKIEASLARLGRDLQKKCNPAVQIKTAFSELPLIRAIHRLIADEKPNMVLVGTDKTSYENDSYIGEQVITIAKTSPVPVLIIPTDIAYKKIEKALVPCDFSAISRLNALQGFRDPKKWLHPELMILNVDPKYTHAANDKEVAAGLVPLLEGYDYTVYHSEDKDTVRGILQFARRNDPQLIIALPGKYSFFYNLTHRSITNALALNATRPVLILK